MRLINITTHEFEEFDYPQTPPYAILSHTWGDGELVYQDLKSAERVVGKENGYAKLDNTSRLAKKAGLQFVWIDTCCIDKTSEAELGEAIRSMFNWYKEAAVCYAYLVDVNTNLDSNPAPVSRSPGSEHDVRLADSLPEKSDFASSRWFTRGWTLQELVAPRNVLFFGHEWQLLGSKIRIYTALSDITGIPEKILSGAKEFKTASIAQRMSWASSRETRRSEDMAYCLLGIFNIQMPLMYGERGENVFRRLQEEILKVSYDHSIFAWTEPVHSEEDVKQRDFGSLHSRLMRPLPHERDLLAKSPTWFRASGDISRMMLPRAYGHRDGLRKSFQLDNKGLHLSLPLIRINGHIAIAVLGCTRNIYSSQRLVLLLRDVSRNGGRFVRIEHPHISEICVKELESDARFEEVICETLKNSADDSDEEKEPGISGIMELCTSWGKAEDAKKPTKRNVRKHFKRIASRYADIGVLRDDDTLRNTKRESASKRKTDRRLYEYNYHAHLSTNLQTTNSPGITLHE